MEIWELQSFPKCFFPLFSAVSAFQTVIELHSPCCCSCWNEQNVTTTDDIICVYFSQFQLSSSFAFAKSIKFYFSSFNDMMMTTVTPRTNWYFHCERVGMRKNNNINSPCRIIRYYDLWNNKNDNNRQMLQMLQQCKWRGNFQGGGRRCHRRMTRKESRSNWMTYLSALSIPI